MTDRQNIRCKWRCDVLQQLIPSKAPSVEGGDVAVAHVTREGGACCDRYPTRCARAAWPRPVAPQRAAVEAEEEEEEEATQILPELMEGDLRAAT